MCAHMVHQCMFLKLFTDTDNDLSTPTVRPSRLSLSSHVCAGVTLTQEPAKTLGGLIGISYNHGLIC